MAKKATTATKATAATHQAGVAHPTDAWTWEDLRQAAEKLTKDGGPWGFGALINDQQKLLAALTEDSWELADLGSREGGQKVERVPPLFPKIESEG